MKDRIYRKDFVIKGFFMFFMSISFSTSFVMAGSVPIFPGAMGFGTETRAAYGLAPGTLPSIYRVTSLSANPNAVGTLGYALKQSGPRIIIFEVSGTIDGDAAGVFAYTIKNPYITIAGQTAPSPGITLKSINVVIQTHDVLIQHLRIRLGDAYPSWKDPNWLVTRDCLSIGNPKEKDIYNIVVDHCSFSWSMDENVEIWPSEGGHIYNVTVSNSIISEGLAQSVRCRIAGDCYPSGHSKGMIVGRLQTPFACTNISIIGNLFAHNYDRNPIIQDSKAAIVNNLIYNPGLFGPDFASITNPLEASVVGNLTVPGADSSKKADYALSIGNDSWKPWPKDGIGSKLFVSGNGCIKCGLDPWDGVDDRGNLEPTIKVSSAPVWPADLKAKASSGVQSSVLSNSGARPADRDSVDQRIVHDVLAGTGKIIDSQNEVGGWPSLSVNHRVLTLPTNPHRDDDSDGYSNLEEWLHTLATEVEASRGGYPISPPSGLTIKK